MRGGEGTGYLATLDIMINRERGKEGGGGGGDV